MRHARAFTLIELLVVIAIIAILIGVLLPSLAGARKAAETSQALAASRTLMQAYIAYSGDYSELVLPAHLTPGQAQATGVRDEFGNPIEPPVSQRWVYRLGPYFDHGWAGTTHVGDRARMLRDFEELIAEGGTENWSYQVSVFPSFGINHRYMGGDFRRHDWIDERHHITRLGQALSPTSLIVFASARFNVAGQSYHGYVDVTHPPLDAVFKESDETTGPATAFGNVHPRYSRSAAIGWLDGHASLLEADRITDRRLWSDPAARTDDARWDPTQ
ncbi:MAG: prepilin-type N-terminal cleavage/methylation domain-containing protein [Phycisphaerales bacterium JB064]